MPDEKMPINTDEKTMREAAGRADAPAKVEQIPALTLEPTLHKLELVQVGILPRASNT